MKLTELYSKQNIELRNKIKDAENALSKFDLNDHRNLDEIKDAIENMYDTDPEDWLEEKKYRYRL